MYTSVVAAQRRIRLQNQRKDVINLKPEISSKVLDLIKGEQGTLKRNKFLSVFNLNSRRFPDKDQKEAFWPSGNSKRGETEAEHHEEN